MKFDVVTIFPTMVHALLSEGVIARAVAKGVLDLMVHDLRSFTTDRHRTVDDVPFGGGPGMVMKPEPYARAVSHIREVRGEPDSIVLTSPQGTPFTHAEAVRLADRDHVVLLCGRYEGVDERVREQVATEELSIGDYVVSGGELPAAVIFDAMARLVPGVIGTAESVQGDSFVRSLLDYPHYTRPEIVDGHAVPPVLLSGNHADIRRWRTREALRRTMERRPEILAQAKLDDEERDILQELRQLQQKRESGAEV